METSKEIIQQAKKRFAELEHKKFDWRSFYNGYLEGQAKQLTLTDVSQRSEQLKSFADWLQCEVWDDKHDDFSDYVEDYIKTL